MAPTLKPSEKISLVGNLATMLGAGIPIFEVVGSLADDAKGNPKKVLDTLKADLAQGRRVYQSFARFPRIFNKVTINVIKASEEAGTLDVALNDLRENIKREAEFNDKIKSALIYPVFILIVFAIVLILVLFLVVPKIATVFSRLRVDLPLPTRILIFLSNTLINYGLFVLLGLAALIVGGIFLFRAKRSVFLNILFSLPIISKLVREIDLTSFSRSLYLLLNSGIPIVSALELTQDVVVKKDMAEVIGRAQGMVQAGRPLSEAFADSEKQIPSIMVKLIEAGERSGSLDKSMKEIQEHFDYEVTGTLKTVTALIEPVMLVVVGIVVGGMMMSIIAPIYGLISQIGAR